MTRRRISNRTPRELTAKERSALSDVVLELDSDFRVKTGSVDDVSQVLPESGVIVLNELDGRLYYADDYGWHRQGDPYSPINLFVDFNGVDQMEFKFKAPSTSTIQFIDGDGTVTDVVGQDGTVVSHFTTYAAAGKYYFTVGGDIDDLTEINLSSDPFVTVDITGWANLTNLEAINVNTVQSIGSINGYGKLQALTELIITSGLVTGDVAFLAGNNLTFFSVPESAGIYGDFSLMISNPFSVVVNLVESGITFDKVVNWELGATFLAYDVGWTSKMVDNCLISLADGGTTGKTIYIGGNNAKRTFRSDAAFAIVDANNTLTVNS